MVGLTMEVMLDDAGQLREPCGYLVRTCIQGEGIAHAKVLRWGMPSFFKKQQGGQWGRQRNSRWEGHSGRDRLMLSRRVRWWRSEEQHEGAGAQVWLKVLVFPPILKRPPVFVEGPSIPSYSKKASSVCWRELWRVSEDFTVMLRTWNMSVCIYVTGCIHLCFSVLGLSCLPRISALFVTTLAFALSSVLLVLLVYIWFILLSKILFK